MSTRLKSYGAYTPVVYGSNELVLCFPIRELRNLVSCLSFSFICDGHIALNYMIYLCIIVNFTSTIKPYESWLIKCPLPFKHQVLGIFRFMCSLFLPSPFYKGIYSKWIWPIVQGQVQHQYIINFYQGGNIVIHVSCNDKSICSCCL